MSTTCPDPSCPTCALTERLLKTLETREDWVDGMVALLNALARHAHPEIKSGAYRAEAILALVQNQLTDDLAGLAHLDKRRH